MGELATILTVSNSDLASLSAEQAVDVFRSLLWAEATANGIAASLINVPSAITVADGGVDAEVYVSADKTCHGLLEPGINRYQIKTGHASLAEQSTVRQILFGRTGGVLRPKIKSCLDQGGRFVIVYFGTDLPETEQGALVAKYAEALKSVAPSCPKPRIEIWQQNQILGFLNKFPSLSLRVNHRTAARFQSMNSWSKDDDMQKQFIADSDQSDAIQSLVSVLVAPTYGRATHARVLGDPGIGKTRLVLEALSSRSDLAPLVIYCRTAAYFLDSDLENELLRDDATFRAVLVVDECNSDESARIWNRFANRGDRIKLITLFTERDRRPGDTIYIDAPRLSDNNIQKILESYGISKSLANRWSDFCGGSPRVAHVIGQNVISESPDVLAQSDKNSIWDRYVAGSDDVESERVHKRRVVLRFLALFKRFGFEPPLAAESDLIFKLISTWDSNISRREFLDIVNTCRERRILQGSHTLYITPKALHIKLWLEWWQAYGQSFDWHSFAESLNEQLLDWFREMFKYAASTEPSRAIAESLLGSDGPFADGSMIQSERDSRFFLALSEAVPQQALEYLERAFASRGVAELRRFTAGRRHVVWSLERIVVWRELFGRAARVLLRLAEAENENFSNNATGVFTNLFSPGPGVVAPTEAPPAERFPILAEALNSGSPDIRRVAIQAFSCAFHYGQMIGSFDSTIHQGLKGEPVLWTPKTYGEFFDAYRIALQLFHDARGWLTREDRSQLNGIFVEKMAEMNQIGALQEQLLEEATLLLDDETTDRRQFIKQVSAILRHNRETMRPDIRSKWKEIRARLVGTDFNSRLRRYVGMNIWEDDFNDEGERTDTSAEQIRLLAEQALASQDLLTSNLDWLLSSEANNAYVFGYEIGKGDVSAALQEILVTRFRAHVRPENETLLAGYLRAISERNEETFQQTLDGFAEDERVQYLVPSLTWRTLCNDASLARVLRLLIDGVISIPELRMFTFGRAFENVSEPLFLKWIDVLLTDESGAGASIALNLSVFYYGRRENKPRLPRHLGRSVLLHGSFFASPRASKRHSMDQHLWTELAGGHIKHYPEDSLEIATRLLESMGKEKSISDGFRPEPLAMLERIASAKPSEVWELVASYLGPPIDSRARHIKDWLHGAQLIDSRTAGGLDRFPPELIWRWVDEKPEERAWYVANFVPPSLFQQEGRVCLAREVLARYGNREEVRNEFSANFSSEGWSGPESVHYAKQKRSLLNFRGNESNSNVLMWIDEYLSRLETRIEQARIEEEREY
ncbi:MAG: hypothetical protein IT585_01990 [candidate division Zixibacteria bacterium]|nr:hypothetical protein [candidate division Zixibacteria bacterium]